MKKSGEEGSRLAPLCRRTRPGRFLGAEEEAAFSPDSSADAVRRGADTCRRPLLVAASCLENLPQN